MPYLSIAYPLSMYESVCQKERREREREREGERKKEREILELYQTYVYFDASGCLSEGAITDL